MKQKLLITLIALFAFGSSINAQIYIDTGNPRIEEKKKEGAIVIPISTVTTTQLSTTRSTTDTTRPSTTTTILTRPSTTTTTRPTSTWTKINVTSGNNSGNVYSGNLNANVADDLPNFAEPGKCYARCYIPDQYNYSERRVLDKAKSFRTQVIPAVYETVYDTVIVTPERKRMETVAATYETISERIMVAPSTTRWEKGKGDANCLSNDPKDCQVMCLVNVPAQYKTINRRVVKTPAFTREITTPATTKIVPRKVLKTPSRNVQIEIPATYKMVKERKLVKEGGYQDWREVLCNDKLTSQRITQIQRALKAKGYDPGPIDDVFGPLTKVALIKYQTDNGLPVGNLNMETMKALGVN